jgi:predicted secreted protein
MKVLAAAVLTLIFGCLAKANCEEPPRLNFEWQGSDDTHFSQNTKDGGHIISGQFWTPGGNQYDFWVLKLNKDGSIAWQKSYGGGGWDIAFSSAETSDGGFIVSGTTSSFGSGGQDVWVLKLDSQGDIVWQKAYGGEMTDYSGTAEQTKDGGYIVVGTSSSFGDSKDIWILKLDSHGNIEWDKTYGDGADESDYFRHIPIKQTSDGGYIVAGSSRSFGAKGEDFWILRLDKVGNIIWQKIFGTDGEQFPTSIAQLPDGTYRVTGTESQYSSIDDWILILDDNGAIIGVHSLENKRLVFFDTSVVPKTTNEKFSNTSATVGDTSKYMVK